MCEIVVVDPDRTDNQAIHQLAAQLLKEQGDGFGILSVQTSSDEPNFTYDAYRHTDPDWLELHKFLERNNEDTWRYILHGRAKTTGGVCRHNTHPLPVDCEKCESIKWVIHNGSIRKHQQNRASLISAGHTFETTVDSEIIPHKVQELPDDIDELDNNTYNIRGNLNYLVFTTEGILVRLSRKYYVTDDFIVSCSTRRRDSEAVTAEYGEMDNDYEWFIITAADEDQDGDVVINRKQRSRNTYYSGGQRSSATSRSSASSSSGGSSVPLDMDGPRLARYNSNNDSIVEIHDDLVPNLNEIVAYKVSPGCVKVVDMGTRENTVEYIYRDENPKLYYYYCRDEHETLHSFFSDDGSLIPADELVGLAQLFPGNDPADDVEPAEAAIEGEVIESTQRSVESAVGAEDEDPLGSAGVGSASNLLGAMAKNPQEMNPPEVALLELTAVYGNSEQAERELKRLTPDQIEEIASNAVHVPSLN